MDKFNFNYEEHNSSKFSGLPAKATRIPCEKPSMFIEINEAKLNDVSNEAAKEQAQEKGLIDSVDREVEEPSPATDEEQEAMRSKTVRFF